MDGRTNADAEVFLRRDTKIEPLIAGWYAWTHLMAPAQLALNIAYRYMPLLQSFVQTPSVHIAATKDPALFGGPFVHLRQDQVPMARQLLNNTATACAQLLQLAKDIRALDGKLQESATGYSLSGFYESLPDSLKGLVEFLYDLNSNPRIRFYEELLHDGGLVPAQIHEIALSLTSEGSRPFFLSTPRLPGADNLHVSMCFDDERIDTLAAMRLRPKSLREVAQMLSIDETQLSSLERFFTTEPASRNSPEYSSTGVRVRYFGHACVLLQTSETSILLDPMLAWEAKADGRLTFDDLPDHIDYVVISHGHQDHCSPEMLLQLRHRIGRVLVPANNDGSVSDPSIKLMLKRLGIRNVEAMRAFDEVPFPGGRIMSLPFPGEHVDLDIYSRHGVLIEIAARRFAFLVDSDGCDPQLFRRIAARVGRELDGLFVGMECHGAPLTWLYGPLLTKSISRRDDESRRLSGLNCERAWKVLQEFSPQKVFVYAMGQEPWLRYIMGLEYTPDSIQLKEVAQFLDRCRDAGIDAENLFMSKELLY